MDRKDSHAFVNQMLVYTLVMICFSGSIGLGTVWLRQQMAQTANSLKTNNARTAEVQRHLAETNTLIAAEQSPDVLRRRNDEWKLGLEWPNESMVVRINGSVEQQLASRRNSELFTVEPLVKPVRYIAGNTP